MVPVVVAPASSPVDIVEVVDGLAFTPPLAGVYMTHNFFNSLLAGVEVELGADRVALVRTRKESSLHLQRAESAEKRVDELEAEKRSWWSQNKFAVGVLIGLVAAAATASGTAVVLTAR